jgi:PAS domain S-box-containing protein
MDKLVGFWTWLIEPAPTVEGSDRRRQARLLATFLVTFVPLGLFLSIVQGAVGNTAVLTPPGPRAWLPVGLAALVTTVAYVLNRAGHYEAAALLVVGGATAGVLTLPIPYDTVQSLDSLAYLLPVVLLSSALLSSRATAALIAAGALAMFLLPAFLPQVSLTDMLIGPLSFFLLGSVLVLLVARHRDQLEAERRSELAENEDRYRSLAETAFEGIALSEAGRVVDANTGFARMFGYTTAETMGLTLSGLISEAERDATWRSIEAGTEQPCESVGLRKDGTSFPIEVVAKVLAQREQTVRAIAVRDISERKRAEEALALRNRELVLLNRAGQALSATLDLGEVLDIVVKEVQNLLGVVACSVWLLSENEEGTTELVCQQATGPKSEVVRGWRLAPGDGLVGWVAQSGESLCVPDTWADRRHFRGVDEETGLALRSILSVPLRVGQKITGVLQVVDTEVSRFHPTDLALVESLGATAAIAVENARLFAQEEQRAAVLARALEQQRELERLRNEFIQNVSHELRTPLAIARGYTELMDRGELGSLQPMQRQAVRIVTRRMRMLTGMMEDMTAILDAATQELRREPVNLGALVQVTTADFHRIAEKGGLTLTAQIEPDLPMVHADPWQLQRVLDNMLGNACKFTPEGGRIIVRLRAEGDQIVLRVSDTGIGVSRGQQERIFERFYQVDGSTRRRYGGVGLGLALVKEIVEAHGGAVGIESELGKGAAFTVRLPAAGD